MSVGILRDKILGLVEIYHPTRVQLHAIVFYYAFLTDLFPEARDLSWALKYHGVYSLEIEAVVETLLSFGLLRECRGGVLAVSCEDVPPDFDPSVNDRFVVESMRLFSRVFS